MSHQLNGRNFVQELHGKSPFYSVVLNNGRGHQMAMPLLSDPPVMSINKHVQLKVCILPAAAAEG